MSDSAERRLMERYDRAEGLSFVESRSSYWYVRTKLDMDPVMSKILAIAGTEPFGDVLDVGCGRGQLALLLGEAGHARSIAGIDWDATKIRIAAAASRDLAIEARWEVSDVRATPLPAADTVLLVDILHYLEADEQDGLLAAAAAAARARILVRDVDPEQGSASTLTKSWDWLTTTLGWNRGARVEPRSFTDIAAALETHGFAVERELCSTRGLSNVLLVARRVSPA